MKVALLLSLLAYAWIILRRWAAWKNLPEVVLPPAYKPVTKLSVIIPVRNEAAHILQLLHDLEKQTFPKALFEILVIDDQSEDATASLVKQFSVATAMSVKLIELKNFTNQHGKKAAVQVGVEQTEGELLVLTDGDCRVQPDWLKLFEFTYTSQKPYFISGPVCFNPTPTLFERMQLVEFSSLIGIGGASIGLKKPNMCNGANLAYTKNIFKEVGGFAGNESIASGDDEFLLHKISKRFPDKVAFIKNNQATVYTEARKTIQSFFAQRIRWASKWKAYQDWQVQLVALIVFVVNLLLFVAIPLVLFKQISSTIFITAYVAKFAVDFLFLNRILQFFNRSHYLFYMVPLQLVYMPYVIYAALCGLSGRYSWKGRLIQTR